jgi:hypothetical protein
MSTFAEAPAGDAAKGAKIFKTKYVYETTFNDPILQLVLSLSLFLYSSHNFTYPTSSSHLLIPWFYLLPRTI